MPNKLKDPYRHIFNKTKYKTTNSREYNQALKNRGSLTIWFSEDVITEWQAPVLLKKKRGGQQSYSNFAITICLTLGLVFKQRLRQTEGLVQSLIKLMSLDLKTPTYSTISVRSKRLGTPAFIKRSSEAAVIATDILCILEEPTKITGSFL